MAGPRLTWLARGLRDGGASSPIAASTGSSEASVRARSLLRRVRRSDAAASGDGPTAVIGSRSSSRRRPGSSQAAPSRATAAIATRLPTMMVQIIVASTVAVPSGTSPLDPSELGPVVVEEDEAGADEAGASRSPDAGGAPPAGAVTPLAGTDPPPDAPDGDAGAAPAGVAGEPAADGAVDAATAPGGSDDAGWLLASGVPTDVGLGVALRVSACFEGLGAGVPGLGVDGGGRAATRMVGPSMLGIGPLDGVAVMLTGQVPAGSETAAVHVPLTAVPATSDIGTVRPASVAVTELAAWPPPLTYCTEMT